MLDSAVEATITSTVSGLPDDQLLEQAGRLARLDHQVHVFVIDHLIEIETRGLYLRRGFSSLFDYVKRGLRYSDAATWRRINAMKLCTRIEGVRERLWDGSLTLDAAAQLQAAFERRARLQRLDRARGTGTGLVLRPNGSARPAPARSAPRNPSPEPSPGPVLDLSAQKALVENAAGKSTREVTRMLAELDPGLTVPADRVRPLGQGRWELKAVVDADCQSGLEQLRGLLSHVDPRMTLGQLVGRLVQEGLDRHDPGRPPRRGRARGASVGADRPAAAQEAISDPAAASAPEQSASADRGATSASKRIDRTGSTGAPATKTDRDSYSPAPSARTRTARPVEVLTSAPKEGARAKRAIPAAVRREVWQRDEGRCRYVDPRGGHRCPSRHLLQIDHVLPYALGGGAEPENLRLLCFAHHRDRHSERTSRRGPPA